MEIEQGITPAHSPADLKRENDLSHEIIVAAIAVHRTLGPGLLESVYHECMKIAFAAARLDVQSEIAVPLCYRGRQLRSVHRIDLLVGGLVIVELNAVEKLAPIHDAQLLTYLRLTGKRLGLLLNFNSAYLKDNIKRIVL